MKDHRPDIEKELAALPPGTCPRCRCEKEGYHFRGCQRTLTYAGENARRYKRAHPDERCVGPRCGQPLGQHTQRQWEACKAEYAQREAARDAKQGLVRVNA